MFQPIPTPSYTSSCSYMLASWTPGPENEITDMCICGKAVERSLLEGSVGFSVGSFRETINIMHFQRLFFCLGEKGNIFCLVQKVS